MLAPPICDLRDIGATAPTSLLMNSHGITIESISAERICYNRETLRVGRIFIFRSLQFSPGDRNEIRALTQRRFFRN